MPYPISRKNASIPFYDMVEDITYFGRESTERYVDAHKNQEHVSYLIDPHYFYMSTGHGCSCHRCRARKRNFRDSSNSARRSAENIASKDLTRKANSGYDMWEEDYFLMEDLNDKF